jgi:mono/diheme cytochrome c family protein
MIKSSLFLLLFLFGQSAWANNNAEDNYKQYCWQCHGVQGNGMGMNIQDMSVQPRDHSSAKSMSGIRRRFIQSYKRRRFGN